MNFFKNLMYRFQNMMYGRYGLDEFSRFLSIASLILLIFSSVFKMPIFSIVAYLSIIYIFVRIFSKNFDKRRAELWWYIDKKSKLMKKIATQKKLQQMKKTHRLYKCRNCKTILRVPKGVGKIKITCSKCKTTMIKKA